jgi:hypothetical protein
MPDPLWKVISPDQPDIAIPSDQKHVFAFADMRRAYAIPTVGGLICLLICVLAAVLAGRSLVRTARRSKTDAVSR